MNTTCSKLHPLGGPISQNCASVTLVGWEINVPFQHKNMVYQGQGLGWRFSSPGTTTLDGKWHSNLPT